MMPMRKLILLLVTVILVGIFTHLSVQYWRSSINFDLVDKDHYHRSLIHYFSNTAKFSDLQNVMKVSCDSNVSMVVLVLSGIGDRNLRNVIRHTWGQWISNMYSQHLPSNILRINYHSSSLKMFFVLGSNATETEEREEELLFIKEESQFQDVLYFPGLRESYMNLTLKTLSAFNTAVEVCPHSTFFVKTDTDVFLNVALLIDLCNTHFEEAQRKPLIIGNKQVKATVIRNTSSKWFIPKSKFAEDFFPDYVTGCGYILNFLAVSNVLNTASKVDELFAWEDVAVTGLYSQNVSIVDSKLFRYESFMSSVDSCYMRKIILAHRISPLKMTSLWNQMVSNVTSTSSSSCPLSSIKMFEVVIRSLVGG